MQSLSTRVRTDIFPLLYEAFAGSFRLGSIYVEVFKNPDLREIMSLREVRFLIHTSEEVAYIWDANNALHDHVLRYLQLDERYENILRGEGLFIPKRGRIVVTDISLYPASLNLSWLARYYFDTTTL